MALADWWLHAAGAGELDKSRLLILVHQTVWVVARALAGLRGLWFRV